MPDRMVILPPIKESTRDYDKLEKRIKLAFREIIYMPLMESIKFPFTPIKNADDPLYEALKSGKLIYDGKAFRGKFSAETSKALRSIGAQWDRKTKSYKIRKAMLPMEIRSVVSAGQIEFEKQLEAIDQRLSKILPEKIADSLTFSDIFDQTLWKVDEEFRKTLKGIIVPPKLTAETRKRIAEEWQTNMRLWIKNFTEEEIVKLRTKVKASAFKGNRYESLIKSIQSSYGVSSRKARFLARQETSLLMAKFKESRYTESGIHEYVWGCVVGSPNHPVRPAHKRLEGKTFRFDNPPITTEPGEPVRRNNPGEDYNCRCFSRPIVKF
jgi:SPP1 gp7 family putative phage head morphogenesis protein